MKLISLNIWGGKLYDPLIQFIKRCSTDIDIFCLQEVFDTATDLKTSNGFRINFLSNLQKILKNFNVSFSPYVQNHNTKKHVDFDLKFGLAIFVKKDIAVRETDEIFIYGKHLEIKGRDTQNMSNKLQYSLISKHGENYNLFNIHGHWYPSDKLDTQGRINQSKKIKKFMDKKLGKKILCGDFNLYPQTKSLGILEEGMKNLIKELNIKTTRSKKYAPNQNFADYILVSSNIKVLDFKVLEDEISDHKAMYLEFT